MGLLKAKFRIFSPEKFPYLIISSSYGIHVRLFTFFLNMTANHIHANSAHKVKVASKMLQKITHSGLLLFLVCLNTTHLLLIRAWLCFSHHSLLNYGLICWNISRFEHNANILHLASPWQFLSLPKNMVSSLSTSSFTAFFTGNNSPLTLSYACCLQKLRIYTILFILKDTLYLFLYFLENSENFTSPE